MTLELVPPLAISIFRPGSTYLSVKCRPRGCHDFVTMNRCYDGDLQRSHPGRMLWTLLPTGVLKSGQMRIRYVFPLALAAFAATVPVIKWKTGDRSRPLPAMVTPGEPSTQEHAGTAPSDAVHLFNGKDLSAWQQRNGKPVAWKLRDGYFEVAPGSGDMVTKQPFGDCQLHVEWATPKPAPRHRSGAGQQRRVPALLVRNSGAGVQPEQDLCRRPGRRDLLPVSAAGKSRPSARRMADLRHRVPRRALCGRCEAAETGHASRCYSMACWRRITPCRPAPRIT